MTTLSLVRTSRRNLADAIAANLRAPPEEFDMAVYECRTSACFVGWFYRAKGERPRHDLTGRLLPSLRGGAPWWLGGRLGEPEHMYLSAPHVECRGSYADDAPFAPTPYEIAVLGARYARGLSEREAAIARARIIDHALALQEAAMVAKEREVVCV